MSCVHLHGSRPSSHTGISPLCAAGCKEKWSILMQLFKQSLAFCAEARVPLRPRAVCEFNRVICSFFLCLQQSPRDLTV